MHTANSDLNKNLIKSLTSVHLPPPPAQRLSQSSQGLQYQQQEHMHQQQSPLQKFSSEGPFIMNNHPHFDQVFTGMPVLQDNINAAPNDLQHLSADMHTKPLQPLERRTSSSIHEFSLPLNTPPHTVTRYPSNEPPRKKKAQETPLNNTRSKKTKNLLSPQYSSPTSKSMGNSSPIVEVTKPPQPTFIPTKQQRKAQRALLKQQQQQQQQYQQASKSLEQQLPKITAAEVEEPEEIPSPRKMPKIIHNSDTKPPYSYATLIGMAILRGEDRKLTLSQIYSWISSTFRYYRKNDVGWQNSIRHNLSLNKAFIKTEKSSDGKGHYWEVQKGHEMQFIKGKPSKRSTLSNNNNATKTEISTDAIKSDNDISDSDVSRTPKSQIRSSSPIHEEQYGERPALKKNHTVIGLQHFHSNGSETEEDFEDDDPPRKKRQLNTFSSSVNLGSLNNIPTLHAPDTNWLASATGEHIIFGQTRPTIIQQQQQRQFSSSSTMTTPQLVVTSPTRATRLSSLSSFGCNTNFETSPLKRQETGPLLEPLTPSSRLASFHSHNNPNQPPLQQQQQHQQQQPSSSSTTTLLPGPQLSTLTKTPLRNSTNTTPGLNTQQNSYVLNFLRTPNTKIHTPNSNSILKKFWNSPSFIDDFYTSPSIPRYSDDDHYKGLFGSPDKSISSSSLPGTASSNTTTTTNNNNTRASNFHSTGHQHPLNSNISVLTGLRGQGEKRQFLEHSGSHGFSDLFGVDIVSVVKRAVENEKKSSFGEMHTGSSLCLQESSYLDEQGTGYGKRLETLHEKAKQTERKGDGDDDDDDCDNNNVGNSERSGNSTEYDD